MVTLSTSEESKPTSEVNGKGVLMKADKPGLAKKAIKAGYTVGKALESCVDSGFGGGSLPLSLSSGSQGKETKSNGQQSANSIEQEETDGRSIEGHNLPFSANQTENDPSAIAVANPNTTTGVLEKSSPDVNIGTTSDAKNTSEKLEQSVDSALSFDRVSDITNDSTTTMARVSRKCTKSTILAFVNLGYFAGELTAEGFLNSMTNDQFPMTNEESSQSASVITSTTSWIKDRWDTLGKTNTDLIQSLWVKTGIISTDVISPLSPDSEGIAVELGPTQTFGIYNKEGSPSAVFDSDGNASFSGTLYADRIVTKFGDLDERLSELIEATQSATSTSTPEVRTSFTSGVENTLDATSSALLALLLNSPVAPSYFKRGAGGVTESEGEVLVDGTILIDQTGISTISDTLYIQPAKLGNLDIMGGTIVVNTAGDVVINGNLAVIGILGVNTIKPLDGFADLVFDATGAARFSGDVIASGAGVFRKLFLTNDATASSSGTATLPALTQMATVSSTLVTQNSLIYITPSTSTGNQVLYISGKEPDERFTVAVDQPMEHDIQFNWWIIN